MNTVNYGHYPIAGDRLWDRFRKKHWNAVDLFLQKGLTCDECGKEIIPQWWALRLATASSMLGSMIAQIISAWLIRTLGCNILIAIIIAIAAMLLFDQLFPALIAFVVMELRSGHHPAKDETFAFSRATQTEDERRNDIWMHLFGPPIRRSACCTR